MAALGATYAHWHAPMGAMYTYHWHTMGGVRAPHALALRWWCLGLLRPGSHGDTRDEPGTGTGSAGPQAAPVVVVFVCVTVVRDLQRVVQLMAPRTWLCYCCLVLLLVFHSACAVCGPVAVAASVPHCQCHTVCLCVDPDQKGDKLRSHNRGDLESPHRRGCNAPA